MKQSNTPQNHHNYRAVATDSPRAHASPPPRANPPTTSRRPVAADQSPLGISAAGAIVCRRGSRTRVSAAAPGPPNEGPTGGEQLFPPLLRWDCGPSRRGHARTAAHTRKRASSPHRPSRQAPPRPDPATPSNPRPPTHALQPGPTDRPHRPRPTPPRRAAPRTSRLHGHREPRHPRDGQRGSAGTPAATPVDLLPAPSDQRVRRPHYRRADQCRAVESRFMSLKRQQTNPSVRDKEGLDSYVIGP